MNTALHPPEACKLQQMSHVAHTQNSNIRQYANQHIRHQDSMFSKRQEGYRRLQERRRWDLRLLLGKYIRRTVIGDNY